MEAGLPTSAWFKSKAQRRYFSHPDPELRPTAAGVRDVRATTSLRRAGVKMPNAA